MKIIFKKQARTIAKTIAKQIKITLERGGHKPKESIISQLENNISEVLGANKGWF